MKWGFLDCGILPRLVVELSQGGSVTDGATPYPIPLIPIGKYESHCFNIYGDYVLFLK